MPESKPNPTIFLKASEQLRIPVEECLVIEDSYNKIQTVDKSCSKLVTRAWNSFLSTSFRADDVIYDIKYLRQEVQVKFGI
ncbi:hypothetical protein EfmJHP38_03170 [Enterococcus faecium]|nr:hypothetical protein EfmJHP38_03170 [Enterococcus faecium]